MKKKGEILTVQARLAEWDFGESNYVIRERVHESTAERVRWVRRLLVMCWDSLNKTNEPVVIDGLEVVIIESSLSHRGGNWVLDIKIPAKIDDYEFYKAFMVATLAVSLDVSCPPPENSCGLSYYENPILCATFLSRAGDASDIELAINSWRE